MIKDRSLRRSKMKGGKQQHKRPYQQHQMELKTLKVAGKFPPLFVLYAAIQKCNTSMAHFKVQVAISLAL